jgi:hypothetical protein
MSTKKKHSHSAVHHGRSLLSSAWRWSWLLTRLCYRGLVLIAEGVFWGVHGARSLVHLGAHAITAAKAARAGVVHCPDGHPIHVGMGNTVHACDACGFRYRGSPLLCPNPECEAPIAGHVNCPTCALSVASPFRSH